MSEWKDYKLGDVVEVKYGKAHQNLKEGNIPAYGSGGFMRNVEKAIYDKESILIPRKGTLNNILFKDEPFWTVDTMFWTKIDINKSYPKFLFYYLTQFDFANMNVGSAVPSMTVPVLNDIDILIPPVKEQIAIASVLSSLDDKIDLLHRQNKTLEQMAETLFRKWFVGDSDEGWEEKSLLEYVELVGGGTPKTSNSEYWDGSIWWLSGGDISTNHKAVITKAEKTITEKGFNNSSAKLLPRLSTVITARGTVGRYCLLGEAMTFSQSNYGIMPKINVCYFFTFLLVGNSVEQLLSAAYGSVFDTITTNTFKEFQTKLPDHDVIQEFEKIVTPYFEKIISNTNQIQSLTKLRDTLLPKLMSGEVRVKM